MQKSEPQHNRGQNQPEQRLGGNASLESPQGEQIAQLEAVVAASPQTGRLAQLSAMANNSPRTAAQRKTINTIHNSPNATAQRQRLESLAGEAAQREEAEEPLQAKVAQREEVPAKPNNTGLPDNLKSGIESLSGMSLDNVKVHYNSPQPAQLNALAYAQGTDIHVAPGQEQHLPHEAWHVVQQAQGRVRPTMQMKDGVPVNDDAGLEREADVMGGRAASVGTVQGKSIEPALSESSGRTVQLLVAPGLGSGTKVVVKRSTSSDLNGAAATILGAGPDVNEYVVQVGDQIFIARSDQLLPEGEMPPEVQAEAKMDEVVRTAPETLIAQIRKFVQESLTPKKPFVLGGSFAALIHAFTAGQSARTPRDIDVILDPEDWPGHGGKPIKTDVTLWGIPLELHKAGSLIAVDETEKESGIIGKNKLLSKALIKVRDQQFRFREVIPASGAAETASGVLATMKKANNQLMAMKDGDPDYMSDNAKEVWIKALVDIQSLVDSGADLTVYNEEEEGDDW